MTVFDKNTMDQIVSAAIVNALGDQAVPLLTALVDKVTSEKVSENGQRDGYGQKTQTMLEYIAKEQLRNLVAKQVRAWMEENTEQFSAIIRQRLDEGGLADAIVAALKRQMESDYRVAFNVSFTLPKSDD